MKWFVSGSAGFIGSNLCEVLIKSGHQVVGIDNFSTGKQENVNRVSSLKDDAYHFYDGDICDQELVKKLLDDVYIFVHLAGQVSVIKSFLDLPLNNRVNIDGFVSALLASMDANVKKFIYASSCAVYGDSVELPLCECGPVSPLSPYATSKLMNEYLASNMSSINPDIQIIGLRFFNIFGPWQDPAGDYSAVIPKWIDLILKNQQPVIFGNGEATRDFCYVENVCNLIERLGKIPHIFFSDIFNIASGSSINLTKLANLILSTIQRSGVDTGELQPLYEDMRVGEIVHSSASINKAQTILGFDPKIDLNTGIENILRFQYGFRI